MELLLAHWVKSLADVRKFPGSRRLPWFNAGNLAKSLKDSGIAYHALPALGGRRRPVANSVNTGWRNEGFRGYADYMQSPEFAGGLEELMRIATQSPTAMMCAEAVPWRCHRSLIADALLVRGWSVLDIFDARKVTPHKLTPFAKVEGLRITYPPTDEPPVGGLFANEGGKPDR